MFRTLLEIKSKGKTHKEQILLKRKILSFSNKLILFTKVSFVFLAITVWFSIGYMNVGQKIRSSLIEYSSNLGFNLETILTEGNYYLSSQDIISITNLVKNQPILGLNLNNIRSSLESNSWIESAIIERRLPNTIYIGLFERNPQSIWQSHGKLYLIDRKGLIISDKKIDQYFDLLHVVGDDANIYANTLENDLKRYPNLAKKVKSAVRVSNRRWNLHLEQGIIVKMPAKNFDAAYDYLFKLDKSKQLFDVKLYILDLRNLNKVFFSRY